MHLVLFGEAVGIRENICFVVCISVTITCIFSFYDVEQQREKNGQKKASYNKEIELSM